MEKKQRTRSKEDILFIAVYFIAKKDATVRSTAEHVGMPKSTVYTYITGALEEIPYYPYRKIIYSLLRGEQSAYLAASKKDSFLTEEEIKIFLSLTEDPQFSLCKEVAEKLGTNKLIRHLRGGEATKRKWKKIKVS
jgi:hypothetical protein